VLPLGRWVHEQRRAHRQGTLDEHRRERLDEQGMVWEPGDEAWEAKIALFRSYHRVHGHLAPKQETLWQDENGTEQPIGQHLVNLRRPQGLGKNQERAEQRAAQLKEIDPDWNAPWPLEAAALGDPARPRRRRTRRPAARHHPRRRRRRRRPRPLDPPAGTGLAPPQHRTAAAPHHPRHPPGQAPLPRTGGRRGPAARRVPPRPGHLAQYIDTHDTHTVKRTHTETVVIVGQEHQVRLGVWISNT
jgi:hypothetical protein